MNLLDQRCLNHPLREAAVQCPSCKRFFCRECVTEHQGRMICVSCVTTHIAAHPSSRLKPIWTLTAALGLLIAWLTFYYLGQTLAKIPSEFHASSGDQAAFVGRPILAAAAFQGGSPMQEPA
jgi:hypothetical protein